MVDNVTTQASALATIPSNTVIATDNILGVDYQRVKITQGPDGTATDVSTATPLPVTLQYTGLNATGISVTPSTQFSVTTTPSSQITVAISSSTSVIGAVMPSTQWTVSVTPSSQFTVTTTPSSNISVVNTSSTAVIGSVMPSTQWTVTTTPSSQFSVTTTPSSQITVANSSSTSVIGAVMPSTQWTITTTPSSVTQHEISSVTASAFNVSASNETGTIYNGTTAITPTFGTITAATSGLTAICTAVTSKSIRVVAMQLVASGATNLSWRTAVSSSTLASPSPLAANGGYVLPYNPVGWFQTVSGEGLSINLSAAATIGGSLTFITV